MNNGLRTNLLGKRVRFTTRLDRHVFLGQIVSVYVSKGASAYTVRVLGTCRPDCLMKHDDLEAGTLRDIGLRDISGCEE